MFPVAIVIFFATDVSAYRPLSFCGPSMSRPSVLPSAENEWQLAQVCRSVITTWLAGSATLRIRQAISGMRALGQRLDDALLGFRRHQRHIAIKDRRIDRIGGDGHLHVAPDSGWLRLAAA